VIADIDESQHPADATVLRCDTAKALISKTNDAVTQVTQDSREILRGALAGERHGNEHAPVRPQDWRRDRKGSSLAVG